MSRKAYMKKWRGLTDDEVKEELEQIALERQIIEDSSFAMDPNALPYPDASGAENGEIDANMEGFDDDNYVEGEEDIDPDSPDGLTDEERGRWNDVLSQLDDILVGLGG